MVWILANDFDMEKAKQPLVIRSPFLEYVNLKLNSRKSLKISSFFLKFRMACMVSSKFAPPEFSSMVVPLEMIENLPSPRVIKTHLPFYLLHPKLLDTSKVIFVQKRKFNFGLKGFSRRWCMVYVARNPKDVIVSYFYHHKLIKFQNFSGDIEQFSQYFMDNECLKKNL